MPAACFAVHLHTSYAPLTCCPLPLLLHSSVWCSKLALTTKFTLDQVLGCALWHAALMAAHEPYRVAAAGLVGKAQQALPGLQPRKAAAHVL